MKKTREHEHRIAIRAPIERVWRALVEAEEIVRWYADEAEVEPGEGGRYRVSWGEGIEGTSRIDAFEPGKRLRLVREGKEEAALDEPIVEAYFLESEGDVTVLRLVQSGIPASADWDDYYEDTRRGWRMFLAGLRHYLERHPGTARESVSFLHPVADPVSEGFRKLVGPEGLAARGSLDAIEAGKPFVTTTAAGHELRGTVLVYEPPYTLVATVDNLEDSILAFDFERIAGRRYLYANLSTFGLADKYVEELRDEWTEWIHRLFPVSEEKKS